MPIPPPPLRPSRQGSEGYPTFLLRLVAYMADSLLLGLILVVVLYLMGLEQESRGATAINVVTSAFFFVYCHKRWGATPGKMLMALQVVSIDGKSLSYLQSLLRYSPYLVAGVVALFLPEAEPAGESAPLVLSLELRVFLGISMFWYVTSIVYMLNRPDRRTLHDLLAYTVVVTRRDANR